jgi:hypothetical protein
MTLDKTNKLTAVHVQPGSGHNCSAACMMFSEVMHEHGQAAVDQLIREYRLE